MAGYVDLGAPDQPPTVGQSLGDAFAAFFGSPVDRVGARRKGASIAANDALLNGRTQEALEKARSARYGADAGERLSQLSPEDFVNKRDSLFRDLVLGGYGSDYNQTSQGRGHLLEQDLRAGAADPSTSWGQMQRNLAAIDGKPLNPITQVGAGGFANIMDERPAVQNTPLGESLITENTANAAANNQLASLREAQRLHPDQYRSAGAGEPLVQVETADGSVYMPRSQAAGQRPATGRPKVTTDNQNAAGFFDRMSHAETLLGDYEPSFTDFAAAGTVLGGGATTSTIANNIMSPEGQRYYQAAADWVRAKLRKESGAAIGNQEMLNEIRTYFPTPGDTPEVIEQKRKAREIAVGSMKRTAGPALSNAVPASASPQPAAAAAPVRVNTPQDAMALPSGTRFMTPDGRIKVRP